MAAMRIYAEIYKYLLSCYSEVPPEQGGILGMKNGVVCAYLHDSATKITDCAVYQPNIHFLNAQIQTWAENGVAFCGIVHSHPQGQTALSSDDAAYISELYKKNPLLKTTYYPLVLNKSKLAAYRATIDNGLLQIESDCLTLVR